MKIVHSHDLPPKPAEVADDDKSPDELRAEAEALLRQADALERWGRERFEAVDRAWNEPDDPVVNLRDGRTVARKYYDPLLHGPAAE